VALHIYMISNLINSFVCSVTRELHILQCMVYNRQHTDDGRSYLLVTFFQGAWLHWVV